MPVGDRLALVLGGGGVTGIAWELGVLAGLAEAGLDLTGADVVVGSSAGSVVGAQITSSLGIDALFQRQLEPPTQERAAHPGSRRMAAYLTAFLLARGDVTRMGARLGAMSRRRARAGRLPAVEDRLAVIRSRLPSLEWPDRDLRLTAIDADTGAFRVITRHDGVSLLLAVAASCAVPGVYPPVSIGDRSYIDGAFRSFTNADLAADCERIVVLAPLARSAGPIHGPQGQLDRIDAPSIAVSPDPAALTAIGKNVLDPAARRPSALAGRRQAPAVLEAIRTVCS